MGSANHLENNESSKKGTREKDNIIAMEKTVLKPKEESGEALMDVSALMQMLDRNRNTIDGTPLALEEDSVSEVKKTSSRFSLGLDIPSKKSKSKESKTPANDVVIEASEKKMETAQNDDEAVTHPGEASSEAFVLEEEKSTVPYRSVSLESKNNFLSPAMILAVILMGLIASLFFLDKLAGKWVNEGISDLREDIVISPPVDNEKRVADSVAQDVQGSALLAKPEVTSEEIVQQAVELSLPELNEPLLKIEAEEARVVNTPARPAAVMPSKTQLLDLLNQ